MAYKLKQENLNKPATAESIKVLSVIGDSPDPPIVIAPILNHVGVVLSPTAFFSYDPSRHYPGPDPKWHRCSILDCFCAMNRLAINLTIRHLLRGSLSRRQRLRAWRRMRLQSRMRARQAAASVSVTRLIEGAF